MVTNYSNFILESKLDKYFSGEISYEDLNIESFLIVTNESISDAILSKIDTILFKAYEWSLIIVSKGISLFKKILNILGSILKFINKLCGKNKKICALIIVLIIMITVGATSAYAASNPTDPNLPEMANAALGFIENISSDLISDGMSENSIRIAESILTEIRDTGRQVDYSHVSKEAQALANSAIKYAENISTENPETFDKLVEIGSKISASFSRNVNGLTTMIGAR
jgi:hypothetical protein